MKKNRIFRKILLRLKSVVLVGILTGSCNSGQHSLPTVKYIEPDSKTATALATVVGDVPLAFTDHILPLDKYGDVIGEADPMAQVDQVFKNIEAVLQSAGTNLNGLVRVHLYLAENDIYEKVLERMTALLPEGCYPAVTVISGGQPREGVLVSMDVVAVAPENAATEGLRL